MSLLLQGTVIRRSKDTDKEATGQGRNFPMMDTQVSDVMFPNGEIQDYTTNVIAENLHSQLDKEGRRYQLLEDIIQHRKNKDAVNKSDGIDKRGRRRLTIKGWDLCAQLKDRTLIWMPLKKIKIPTP